MTTFSLSLSADPSGAWTLPASRYAYSASGGTADTNGRPVGEPTSTSESTVAGSAVSLPWDAASGTYQQKVFTNISFGSTRLAAPSGLVTMRTYVKKPSQMPTGFPGYTGNWETITADGPWNLVKDIAVTEVSSQSLLISSFVDVRVDLPKDKAIHDIHIEGAKRGTIVVNGTTTMLDIRYLSNEYGWSNTFDVKSLYANLDLNIAPMDPTAAAQVQPLTPMTFNTAPQNTHLNLDLGNGTGFNSVTTAECSSSIHLGPGSNTLDLTDGHNEIWADNGGGRIAIHSRNVLAGPGLETDIGSDLIHLVNYGSTVFLDDANRATAPKTTIELDHTAVTGGRATNSMTITSGHYTLPGDYGFVAGDWSHLTLDLHGFDRPQVTTSFTARLDPYVSQSFNLYDKASGHSFSFILQGATVTQSQLHVTWS